MCECVCVMCDACADFVEGAVRLTEARLGRDSSIIDFRRRESGFELYKVDAIFSPDCKVHPHISHILTPSYITHPHTSHTLTF